MESMLRVPVAMAHAVLPSMIERKAGIIISTTLQTGIIQLPFMSAESVAKSALIKFHHQLDLETSSKGIISYAVNPGPIPSHLHDPSMPFVLNPEHAAQEMDAHQKLTAMASKVSWAAAGLASGTFLTLCAEPRARVLSGLYVNAERDLEELITRMEKDRGRKVARDRMYVLKVDEY